VYKCSSYIGYKAIRGDGNCYYRAIIYGLLEQIITRSERHQIKKILGSFKKIIFSDFEENQHHERLVQVLSQAVGNDHLHYHTLLLAMK
jgi:hypothetical protein